MEAAPQRQVKKHTYFNSKYISVKHCHRIQGETDGKSGVDQGRIFSRRRQKNEKAFVDDMLIRLLRLTLGRCQ